MSNIPFPHLHIFPQVSGFSQRRSGHLEDLVHSSDAQVPQTRVVPSLAGLPHRESSFVGLSPSSPIGERHVDKQLGVREILPGQRLEWDVSIAWLKRLQRDGVLTCGGTRISGHFKALLYKLKGIVRFVLSGVA